MSFSILVEYFNAVTFVEYYRGYLKYLSSLGSGTPFLRKWETQQANVAVWSGESGAVTLRETAQRIAKADGIDFLGDVVPNVLRDQAQKQAQ